MQACPCSHSGCWRYSSRSSNMAASNSPLSQYVLPRLLRTEASSGASRLASRYSAMASSSLFCSCKISARLECACQNAGFRLNRLAIGGDGGSQVSVGVQRDAQIVISIGVIVVAGQRFSESMRRRRRIVRRIKTETRGTGKPRRSADPCSARCAPRRSSSGDHPGDRKYRPGCCGSQGNPA